MLDWIFYVRTPLLLQGPLSGSNRLSMFFRHEAPACSVFLMSPSGPGTSRESGYTWKAR